MTTRLRRLAVGAVGLAAAATLSTAVPAAAAAPADCGAGQLCVRLSNGATGTPSWGVVHPDRLPACSPAGFGPLFRPLAAINNSTSDAVFFETRTRQPDNTFACSGRSTTVPPGGAVEFDYWVKGMAVA